MITLLVGLGCACGGIIVGYAYRGKEHDMIAQVVRTTLADWQKAKNLIKKV